MNEGCQLPNGVDYKVYWETLTIDRRSMKIRESVEKDKQSIRNVHQNAFGELEGESVSQLAIDLLEDKTALPILSLVAERDRKIIGHIIFSSVNIDGADGILAYILAPLAVAVSEQKNGLGTLLINKGIDTLKARGADIVLVYGDPNYYKRTGFTSGHNLKPPQKLSYPIEAWMAQELVTSVLTKTQGTVRCALSLNLPEHW